MASATKPADQYDWVRKFPLHGITTILTFLVFQRAPLVLRVTQRYVDITRLKVYLADAIGFRALNTQGDRTGPQ